MASPDYAFYRDEYGGALKEAAFEAAFPAALALVGWLVGGKPVPDECEAARKRAVCAAVEALSSGGEGGFSIGSFSVSGGSRSADALASDAARRELAGTGLLFSGVA